MIFGLPVKILWPTDSVAQQFFNPLPSLEGFSSHQQDGGEEGRSATRKRVPCGALGAPKASWFSAMVGWEFQTLQKLGSTLDIYVFSGSKFDASFGSGKRSTLVPCHFGVGKFDRCPSMLHYVHNEWGYLDLPGDLT